MFAEMTMREVRRASRQGLCLHVDYMLHILSPSAPGGGKRRWQGHIRLETGLYFGDKEKTHCALSIQECGSIPIIKIGPCQLTGEEVWLFQELRDEMGRPNPGPPAPAERATVSRTVGGRGQCCLKATWSW